MLFQKLSELWTDRIGRKWAVALSSIACLTVIFIGSWSGFAPSARAALQQFGAAAIAESGWLASATPALQWEGTAGALAGLTTGAGLCWFWDRRRSQRRRRASERQVERLQEQLDRQDQTYRVLEGELQAVQAERDRLEAQWQRATADLADLRAAADRDRQALTLERNLAIERADGLERDLEAIRADVEQTWDREEALKTEADRLGSELAEVQHYAAGLEDEVASLYENLEGIWKHQPASESAAIDAAVADAGDREFDNLEAAVDAADRDFGDVLEIWDSARASAADAAQFGRPGDAYRALAAIAAIGRDYFAAAAAGASMGSWREAFRRHGFEFKPTEHQVTRTLYGSDRDFKHQGRKRRMLKHLTLGSKNPVHTLQIYFEVDRETNKIDVGYCGKHLRCQGRNS